MICDVPLSGLQSALIVDVDGGVLDGAVDGELAAAVFYAPLDDLAVTRHVPHLRHLCMQSFSPELTKRHVLQLRQFQAQQNNAVLPRPST